MGLDMFLEGHKFLLENHGKPELNQMEDGFRIKDKILDLGYWRKHPNLHGYIVQTFADGRDECQDIELTRDSLANIIEAVKDRRLPHTEGFFFGQSDGTERDEDIAIFEKALEWLSNEPKRTGNDWPREWRSVVYRASW